MPANNNLLSNIPHMFMAIIAVVAACVLAGIGKISGDQALLVISGVVGFSVGVGGSSASSTAVAPIVAVPSTSDGKATTPHIVTAATTEPSAS